jgi:hypothetical protein
MDSVLRREGLPSRRRRSTRRCETDHDVLHPLPVDIAARVFGVLYFIAAHTLLAMAVATPLAVLYSIWTHRSLSLSWLFSLPFDSFRARVVDYLPLPIFANLILLLFPATAQVYLIPILSFLYANTALLVLGTSLPHRPVFLITRLVQVLVPDHQKVVEQALQVKQQQEEMEEMKRKIAALEGRLVDSVGLLVCPYSAPDVSTVC